MTTKFTLRTKLFAFTGALLALLAVLAFVSISKLSAIDDRADRAYQDATIALGDISKMRGRAADIDAQVLRAQISFRHAADARRKADENMKVIDDVLKKYTGPDAPKVEQQEWAKARTAVQKQIRVVEEIFALAREDKNEQASQIYLRAGSGAAARAEQVERALVHLQDTHIALAKRLDEEVNDTYASGKTITLIVLIVGMIAGLAVAWWLVRDIVTRVRAYGKLAEKVAANDLSETVEPAGADELTDLAHNLNAMVNSLRGVTGLLRSGSDSITESAAGILSAANQQAAAASEQSAAINETTTAVEEVRSSAAQASDRAATVASSAQRSLDMGEEGRQSVQAITAAMEDIRAKVDAIATGIVALSEQTQQIGDITSTVNDLADQSNLLALNAAIEAARAGEQGKGFAVVADEVRNLAEQSKQATVQVQAILGEIQSATATAVRNADSGAQAVADAGHQVDHAGAIITSLIDANNDASQSAQQIAAAAQEQTVGMGQIAQAMNDTSRATDQFVSGMEESRRATEQLNDVARELQQIANQFKV